MEEDKSLLIEFLGENTLIKVLDFLLEKRPFDTTKEEIIKGTGVSRNTFYAIWKRIEKFKLVKKTRTIGRATLYVLDENNPITKQIIELEHSLIENNLRLQQRGEKEKVPA